MRWDGTSVAKVNPTLPRGKHPPGAFPPLYAVGGLPVVPGASIVESSCPFVPSGISVKPAF